MQLCKVECPFPHVSCLQCAAGGQFAGKPSLLAASEASPRQVSLWLEGAIRESSASAVGTDDWAHSLVSCRFSRRSGCNQRPRRRNQETTSRTSHRSLDHHGYRSEISSNTLWRGECLLLSARFCLRDPALPAIA